MNVDRPGDRRAGGLSRLGAVSISSLMLLILTVALTLAGLRSPSTMAASLAFSVAMTSLLVVGLAVALDRSRTFALGYLIFGGGYAALAFVPIDGYGMGPHLLTTVLITDLHDRLGHNHSGVLWRATVESIEHPITVLYSGHEGPIYMSFQRIGHSSAVIVHGLFGGLLARLLAPRRHNRPVGLEP